MRLSAWSLLLLVSTLLATLGLGIWGLATRDRDILLVVLGLLGVCSAVSLAHLHGASDCFCPLCRMRVFGSAGCQRSAKAGRTFGSYRLRVASRIVTTGSFRCPYCGETTRCRMAPQSPRG